MARGSSSSLRCWLEKVKALLASGVGVVTVGVVGGEEDAEEPEEEVNQGEERPVLP